MIGSRTAGRPQHDRIKILSFLSNFAIGGTERQVVNLVKRLDRSRFEPSFCCFRKFGEFLPEIEERGIPVSKFDIHTLYRPGTILQQIRFAKFLRTEKIDILHTYGFYTSAFAIPAAKLAGVPAIVASIRDIGAHLTARQQRAQRLVCRFADSILVNAQAVRNWLTDTGCRSENVEVIRNGIDVTRFKEVSVTDLRSEIGVPSGVPLVAVLGRVNENKGAEYFIDAAGAVAAEFPTVRFLFIGDVTPKNKAYKEQLEARAHRLGIGDRVLFAGFRKDVPELLPQISVSVLPSLSEGLSNALIESMAAGVPVISTNVGGSPEIVQDGVTGFLVPPRNAGTLAARLRVLLRDAEMARRFGDNGRQRIANEFDLDKMVSRTEQHYTHLLERTVAREARRASEVRA